MNNPKSFSLDKKVVVITGASGFLGLQHADAVAEAGGMPVLLDISEIPHNILKNLEEKYGVAVKFYKTDILIEDELRRVAADIENEFGRVDALVNSAAIDMKMRDSDAVVHSSRFEDFPIPQLMKEFEVQIVGSILSCRVFGGRMVRAGGGSIINISSDLGLISPDQRVYEIDGLKQEQQPVKAVSYSIVKHGVIGLTRYLSTYWGKQNVRVNALCPGGMFSGQPEHVVQNLASRIPLSRMARDGEFKGAVQFLCSDASSYMTGACLVLDGGRSVW